FVELRKRRKKHRPLSQIEMQTEAAREEAEQAKIEFDRLKRQELAEFEREFNEAKRAVAEQRAALESDPNINPREAQLKMYVIESKLRDQESRRAQNIENLEREEQTRIKKVNLKLRSEIQRVRDNYKLFS